MDIKVINGESIEIMQSIEDNSIDSIATDSPYGIGLTRILDIIKKRKENILKEF